MIQTEAGGVPGVEAKTAVGWTLLNRMHCNHVTTVHQAWRGFNHDKPPLPDTLALAKRLLSGNVPDPTDGATHFYTPQIMPKEEATIPQGFDIGDGLESVAGVKDRHNRPVQNYRPSFADDPRFKDIYIKGVDDFNFKFYKAAGTVTTR